MRVKKNKMRSSQPSEPGSRGPYRQQSTVTAQFRRCSSVPSPVDPKSIATAMGSLLKKVEDSYSANSLAPSASSQNLKKTSTASPTARRMGCSVPLQWSRTHKGIRTRRKVLRITSKRSTGRNQQETITESFRHFAPGKASRQEMDPMSQDDILGLSFGSSLHSEVDILLNTNISHKYQPKLFQDIAGHEITIKTISKAIEKEKIARLYLFHGSSGTGKTSTARIFMMALNCESTSHTKPCWSCRSCSRSLYVMGLCSGSRMPGFERIKTLLHSTSFTQAIPGFKVLIIKDCHSFNAEAWGELLGIMDQERGSKVVFVLITTDASIVPINISSRCQKFCFPKLKDEEIAQKLSKILACEGVRIEKEALKLITTKAEGSLKEAEHLLDQLALLGSIITSSMVQQLVGLVPQSKLLELLATAISGDTIETIRYTRELIVTGVEPQIIVSQLASLVTDILSGTDIANSSSSMGSSKGNRLLRSRSQLTNTQSERLCHALKVLVETEKQLRLSTEQNSRLMAALLEITSEDVCNRISTGINLPKSVNPFPGGKPNAVSEDISSRRLSHGRSNTHHHPISRTSEQLDVDKIEPGATIKSIDQIPRSRGDGIEKWPNTARMSDMEEIWQNMLGGIESGYVKDFLCCQVKLASLTVSTGNVIVHLLFKRQEDKMAAHMSEGSISRALQNSIGCPVTINMSLEPVDLGIIKGDTISTDSQLVNSIHSKQQQRIPSLSEFCQSRNFEAAMHHSTAPELYPLSENSRTTTVKDCITNQRQPKFPSEEKEADTSWPQKVSPFVGLLPQKNQLDTSPNLTREGLTIGQTSMDTAHIMRPNKAKHRWLSLSSIPQSDASVEPYSQDILFENANKKRESNRRKKHHKFQKGFLKTTEVHDAKDSSKHQKLNTSWSCTDVLCPRKTKGRNQEETIPAIPEEDTHSTRRH
ncbi:Protein STICHEL-like [Actinidia chinensis var. chinensis]|uniref:Protein STICHEL-like n=1 Tax=Actinidia chinensis var. chinensis TaxID=1590841 RepID=A0A2R6PZ80_ACTCC|nr:Protein STICHEL-like [Actinidia chinensis var. chinensis]